jgi:hypothetical protein
MARVLKGRRQAYDNIAVASDYGEERVIAGALLPEGERLTP